MSEPSAPLFDYQHDPARRAAFHDFVETIFPGLSLREWDALGGWDARYRPASIFDGPRVAANVSVSPFDCLVQGEIVPVAQYGTVGTRRECRRRGLAARLMEAWFAQLDDCAAFQFLFANEEAFPFYERLGFRRVAEHAFHADVAWPATATEQPLRALDVRDPADREIILGLLRRREPVSRTFGPLRCEHIELFHLLNRPGALVYHFEQPEALVAVRPGAGTLHVFDLAATEPVSADRLLRRVVTEPTRTVVFHFTPDRIDLPVRAEPDPESAMFVRGAFPLEGTPFRFAALAQT